MARGAGSLYAAANLCLISAILWVISTALLVTAHETEWVEARKAPGGVENLDQSALEHRWHGRRQRQGLLVSGMFFSCFAWITLLSPARSLAKVLDAQGPKSASNAIFIVFVVAAALTVVEFTAEAGLSSTSDWISRWPEMMDEHNATAYHFAALQSLEISYIMVHSRTLWLYAMDRLLFATGIVVASCLTYSTKQLSPGHAHLGLFAAFLAVLGFSFEVSRFVDWEVFVEAGLALQALLDGVILPIWLVWLGWQLRGVSDRGGAIPYERQGGGAASTRQQERSTAELGMGVEVTTGVEQRA